MIKPKLIACDFDGVCVSHRFPEIGKTIPDAVYYLKRLAEFHFIVLWTARIGFDVQEAMDWFKEHEIPLYGVLSFPEEMHRPHSRKIDAQVFIDDKALGVPLKADPYVEDGWILNWSQIDFADLGLLPDHDS